MSGIKTIKHKSADCRSSKSAGSGAFGETQLCIGKIKVYKSDKLRGSRELVREQKFKCIVKYMQTCDRNKSIYCDEQNAQYAHMLENERNILLSIQGHPNIVNIIPNIEVINPKRALLKMGNSENIFVPYYVMEYCTQGDSGKFTNSNIYKKIKKNKIEFSALVRNYISDIYSGIKYIHGKNYIHSDVKPANIFVTMPENIQYKSESIVNSLVFKIGDFGSAIKPIDSPSAVTLLYSPNINYVNYVKHFQDYCGFALSLYNFITNDMPREPIICALGGDSKYIINYIYNLNNTWADALLTEEVLKIVKTFFEELIILEKNVIDTIDKYFPDINNINSLNYDNHNNASLMEKIVKLNTELALDTSVYQNFYTKMSSLNNYKFVYTSNDITNQNVDNAIKTNMLADNTTIQFIEELPSGVNKVNNLTRPQRIRRLGMSKKRLLKSGANVAIVKHNEPHALVSHPLPIKLTGMQRIKHTLKNLLKRK
jgi:serine/threonine protein kinase